MPRHLYLQIDRAEQLEERVQELAKETNQALKKLNGAGAQIEADLLFREPKRFHKSPFSGFVGVTFTFDRPEPKFLSEGYRKLWINEMERATARKFGLALKEVKERGLDCMYIEFSDVSEESLYELTESKEEILKAGFKQVSEFAKLYCESVREYALNHNASRAKE